MYKCSATENLFSNMMMWPVSKKMAMIHPKLVLGEAILYVKGMERMAWGGQVRKDQDVNAIPCYVRSSFAEVYYESELLGERQIYLPALFLGGILDVG